ncbi:tetratricopeptide repeat protein [Stieleria varia]|uniref:Lipoprotein NlpI n=1 Tax=Stieleria varia TaxID=2528005 RepID=A0A5C6B3S4_9BACT|nr:tetratricopeptide repeat protein [Stieleria varia]TWU05926.1 lipoprotein NlpI [Stieleria varia]
MMIRMMGLLIAACCLFANLQLCVAQESLDDTPIANFSQLSRSADAALRSGDITAARAAADGMAELADKNSEIYRIAADVYLRAGDAKSSLKYFDEYLKSHASELPYLWQRGIALYFVGDFAEGAKQFEEHRHVNPNDVENAAWHFLCVAKAESFQASQKQLLPAPGDRRVPMDEVLEMLKTGDTDLVVKRMESIDKDSPMKASADFYGEFYLGLYADAKGKRDEAQRRLERCAKNAPRNYMGDVARVYAKHLSQAK